MAQVEEKKSFSEAARIQMGIPYEPDQPFIDNKAYWDTRNFAEIGRLAEVFPFLPGRKIKLKTLDIQEQAILGKLIDQEAGKLSSQTGIASSYDEIVQWLSVAMSILEVDGQPLWTAITPDEDPDNLDLSMHQRELALIKRFSQHRDFTKAWPAWLIRRAFEFYALLRRRQKDAIELLPKYSERGEPLTELSAISVAPTPGDVEI